MTKEGGRYFRARKLENNGRRFNRGEIGKRALRNCVKGSRMRKSGPPPDNICISTPRPIFGGIRPPVPRDLRPCSAENCRKNSRRFVLYSRGKNTCVLNALDKIPGYAPAKPTIL